MEEKINNFIKLNKLFKSHGFNLYLVGGTVRDYLFHIPLSDMDVVTDASPEEMKAFLPNANYHFEKFGSVSYKDDEKVKFDITTLREESEYIDSRHPGNVKFVKDLKVDVKRRDFTINGLYMDVDLKVIDYVDGEKDIKDKILRMIGNADKRLNEDPLRIIRAFRFAVDFGLTFDEELDKAIRDNASLLMNLNIEKIEQDIRKLKGNRAQLFELFELYNINRFIDVIN